MIYHGSVLTTVTYRQAAIQGMKYVLKRRHL